MMSYYRVPIWRPLENYMGISTFLPPQVIHTNEMNPVAEYVNSIKAGLSDIMPADFAPFNYDANKPCAVQEVNEDILAYLCKYKAHLVSSDLAMSAGVALQIKQHCGEFSQCYI
jgi:hypothetical protein